MARRLARILDVPHVELDALFWRPQWVEAPIEEFRAAVDAATAGDAWVVDGNYFGKTSDILWTRADTVVWLDFGVAVSIRRLLRRTARRAVTREELWGTGNRETVAGLIGRDSLIAWAIRKHPEHQQRFPEAAARHRNVTLVRLRTPRQAERWLRSVAAGRGAP
jgi:adenylate kinase family enzyme